MDYLKGSEEGEIHVGLLEFSHWSSGIRNELAAQKGSYEIGVKGQSDHLRKKRICLILVSQRKWSDPVQGRSP